MCLNVIIFTFICRFTQLSENNRIKCMSETKRRRERRKKFLFLLPPFALDHLTLLNNKYPMLFKITNEKIDRLCARVHCPRRKFYIPFWMMRNLLLEEGDLVTIENVALPIATISKFQPQSVDLFDITNTKAVLSHHWRLAINLTAKSTSCAF